MAWRSLSLACLGVSAFSFLPAVVTARAAAAGYHIFYERGRYMSKPDALLKRDEEWARRDGGHMPWRRDPLLTARVLAAELVPVEAGVGGWTDCLIHGRRAAVGGDAAWVLIGEHDGKALTRLLVSGRPVAEVRLIQPFGYWWWVSSARRTDVSKSRAVVIHPDGAREFMGGPLRLVGGRAYLPVRDLERVQLGVRWDSGKQAAVVYVPESDNIAWFRPGEGRVYGVSEGGGAPCYDRISWRPFVVGGRLFVQARDTARWFPTFVPEWDCRCGELWLHIRPFRWGGPRE